MMYIASVIDKETKELKIIKNEYQTKKAYEKDLRLNGYSVKFITTEEKFDEDCEKYHERLEKQRNIARAIREHDKRLGIYKLYK